MNGNHMLRLGTLVGFGLFTLAGCGGPDAALTEPELSSVEQGINVATNGSFETHAIGSVNSVILNAGSTALPGWTITSAIKVMKSPYKAAQDGVQSIDLNGYDWGSLYQDVPTVVGAYYSITFYASVSPACATVRREATISYGPKTSAFSTTSGAWSQPRMYGFTATSTTTRIEFTSTSTFTNCGLAIDNFKVSGP
ncbi:DUF642 domain-containing protein [Corallococcus sp. AB038B]|uniref:DUF642 domain-containing protein n=1 Tax=Corallococcus sp. AB038B TaxID=2316718 RepID=UPI000EEE9B3F|nr:DUF642 domain-containing protein [Corallococcus sp. AB038B]RKH96645.1 DUF642 domain-containing protein [Corallococcus sp. AB038B]